MKNDVQRVIAAAAKRNIEVGRTEATNYCSARRILQADPDHVMAREVCQRFAEHLTTGVPRRTFWEFMLPREHEQLEVGRDD